MMFKKDSMRNLFYNRKFVFAFSLIVAFVFWLVITINQNPERTRVFSNITVSVSTEGTAAGELGLDVISKSADTVSVKVSGPSYVIASLSSSDISVSASIAEVTEAGTYELGLTAACAESGIKVLSVSPAKVSTVFDYVDTKLYNLEVEAVGATAVSGLIVDTPSVSTSSDSTISVTGARTELEKIARVVAVADVNSQLKNTSSFDADIHLYDAEGKELDKSAYSLSVSKVKITVPILKQKEVPIKVTFSNKPKAYANKDISYTASAQKVTIMGPESSIDTIESVSLAPINFDSVSKDNNSFDVAPILPNGVKLAENIETVTVVINTSGFSEGTYNVTEFKFQGTDGKKVTASGVRNVKICGPSSAIRKIKSSGLYAVADLTGKAAGVYTVPVRIYAEDYDNIWQVGTYEVVVTVK